MRKSMLWGLVLFALSQLAWIAPATAATVYQAESAALTGGTAVATDHTGYTGTGFVGGFTDTNKGNAKVTFSVSAGSAGSYTLGLRYANGTGSSKTLSLIVNGTTIKQTTLGATSNWDTWATQTETVTLASGTNTVAYQFTTGDSGNVNVDSLTVDTAGSGPADLVVTGISWSPASPVSGNEITFSATIQNQGGTATPAGTKHGINFTVNGTQVAWSDNNTTSLAAGASRTQTANWGPAGKASWTGAQGTFTVQATIDDQNLIAEGNEGNNTSSASLTVAAPSGTPDLVVTNLTWSPANPQAPSAVTFTATIKNQGSVATPAVKHGISFLVDGTQVNWNDAYTASLAAGASVTLTANGGPAGTASWASTSGTHTVSALVDDVALIAEGNESNNTLSASLTVSAAPALANGLYRIRNFWQSTQYLYESGGKVLYGTPAGSDPTSQWALVDLGTKKALWNASTGNYMTVTGVTTSADPVLTNYTDTTTGAQWTIAAGTNAGYWTMQNAAQTSWYVTLEGLKGFAQAYAITPSWGSPQWAFESVGTVPTRPAAKPDLVVTDLSWSPSAPTPGQAVTFSAVVRNQGVGATPAGTVLGVDFAVNGTKVTWSNNYSTSLAAGSSVTLTANAGTNGATWAMAGSAPTVTATVDPGALVVETNETNNAFNKVLTTAVYGATVPYTTYEAENGTYTGALISGSRAWGTLASEASARAAVQLTSANQYVQFPLTSAAQGLMVRYSIPDTATGSAYNAGLSLYVGGVKKADLTLTNKYSWIYGLWGTEGGNKRWSNNPNATPKNPHRFFDEVAVVLDASYPAGTVIKLVRESSNLNFSTTASVTIDLVDAEALPALKTMPSNYVSLTSYGAVANDGADDTTAMTNAIAAVTGSGGTKVGVWIPAGTFDFNNGTVGPGWNGTGTRIYLPAGVSLKGTGMWTSTLQGAFAGVYAKGGNSSVADLKISPYDVLRDDDNGVSGMEGNFTGGTIDGVWVEHAKVGVWVTQSWALPGIPSNVTVINNRIRNVWADGLNFHYGTNNSTASNNTFRNTGDDGMAMWSEANLDFNNTFQFNTIQLPGLANGIGIYGGKDNKVLSNLVEDVVDNGAGIQFGTNFSPPSLTGTLQISNNKFVRTGSYHHDYGYGIGAIWGYWVGSSGRIASPVITISNNLTQDSTYAGIFLEEPQTGVSQTFTGNTLTNSGTYGVEIRSTATGAATFNTTLVTGAPSGNLRNNSSSFTITGSGNNF